MKDSGMKSARACSLDNYLQFDMYFVASAPLLSLPIAWETEKSSLHPPRGRRRSVGRHLHGVLVLL